MSFNVDAAKQFVLRMYDPAVGFCRAAPNAEPNNYYIYNDGYLVNLLGLLRLNLSKYPQAPTHVSVLDGSLPAMTLTETVPISNFGDKRILSEIPTSTAFTVGQYADLDLYYILSLFNQGMMSTAKTYLSTFETRYWDGAGFRDKSWTGLYQLYKNALYLIVCNRLAVEGKFRFQCLTRINAAQVLNRPGFSNQQGGCLTEYGALPTGDVNIETSVLCVIALE